MYLLAGTWWAVQDSNLRPPVCKTDALPTELTARCSNRCNKCKRAGIKCQKIV